MKFLEKISSFFGKYMALVVLSVAAPALLKPETCLWIDTAWINYLLMVIMFGMGLTLKWSDFHVVFVRPKEIVIGCVAQFTVMPTLAFIIGHAFGFETGLLAGMVLVGACPGGTSSNVITYLSKGDVALSVGMTSVNTLLAPFFTPALVYLFLNAYVDVDLVKMFVAIAEVVLIPIGLGCVLNRYWGRAVGRAVQVLPAVSVLAITAIVAAVVSHNAAQIKETGVLVLLAVALHNLLGYLLGYCAGVLGRTTTARKRAIAIEVGMQNSGLATSLAKTAFHDLASATVPGAVFSVWHNVSGAILAYIFRRLDAAKESDAEKDAAKDGGLNAQTR
ncbi:MAG: bile acid:sodium symporter family protein [Thermoguttaceae bacterium]